MGTSVGLAEPSSTKSYRLKMHQRSRQREMSRRDLDGTDFRDANPRVRAEETCLRAACGRHTVDIVPATDSILAVVGDGVGRPPVSAPITPATVAAVLSLACSIDERSALQTQVWPLTA